ncbi:MAG: FG-GAP repeat protein [Candidatus Cloacimonetes bacterium]|nr:FG-GAP repeat protein [Candidatus Cloacimonadota bacterium]
MRFIIILIIVSSAFSLLIAVDQRQESARELISHKITAADYQNSKDYATAIDLDGDWLIVGAPLDNELAPNAGSAYIYHWDGSTWSNEYKLFASDAEENDQFGCSVAISGDMALVGAWYEDTRASNAGAVYAFYYDGADWTQQKLMANDGEAHNHFGRCLDLDANAAVIGAPGRSETGNQSGVIYTFTRSGNSWIQHEKLFPTDNAMYDYFGSSVSISGNWIATGSTGNDEAGNGSGAVYFYQNSAGNWLERDKVIASDTTVSDEFGYAVAIDGDYALLTAWKDDDNGPNSGSAYIFKRDGLIWNEQDKITPSNAGTSDMFGNSASLDGDYAVVGAAYYDDDDLDCGSAWVFYRTGTQWDQIDILLSDVRTPDDLFGYQVAIDGTTIAVGCPGDDDNGIDSGSVFSFQNTDNDFSLAGKVFASDGFAYRYFGSVIAMDADWLAVGVPLDNDNGEEAGAVYIYHWTGSEWSEESKFSGSDTEDGDQFGSSIAIQGQDIMIGAWHEDTAANNAGAVYYYRYDGRSWQEQKLVAFDATAHAHFGFSVSFDGNLAAVGAPGCYDNGSQSGAVYLFEKIGETWQNPTKYIPADNVLYDYLGRSVAVSGNRMIAGATGVDDHGNSSGAAYILDLSTTDEIKLFPSDVAVTDNFGGVVAISGNYALISSVNDDDFGPNSGSAYIFYYNGTSWIQQQKLTPSSLHAGDYFGSSLSLNDDYAAVASFYHSNTDEQEGGTVFLYQRILENWNILLDLSAPDPSDFDWFGKAVAISDDRAACGWIGDDDYGIDTGAVMIFHDLDTVTPLASPSEIIINATAVSGVDIFFDSVSGATGYKIYASDSVEGPYSDISGTGSFSQIGEQMQWSSPQLDNRRFFKVIALQESR